MKNFNLKGRVLRGYRKTALTIGFGADLLTNGLKNRKFVATGLLGKLMAIALLLGLIPTQTPSSELNTAQKTSEPKAKVQLVISADGLDVASSQKNLETTVVESKHEETERIAREEAEKTTQKVVVATAQTSAPAPAVTDVPFEQKRALAQRAAASYGIDWKILEAVWQVESGKRYYTSVSSYAGAQGPMQFMPATWRAYQVDGNGDGYADIHNAEDAVYAAANYLAANGGAHDIDRALLAYNHAQWYVDKVKNLAATI